MHLVDMIPEPLRAMGPGGLELWQWLGIAVILVVAIALGRLAAWLFTFIGTKLAGQTTTSLDDDLLRRLRSPLRALGSIGVLRIGVVFLQLPPHPNKIGIDILLAAFALCLVWGALRAIDVMTIHLSSAAWVTARPSSR